MSLPKFYQYPDESAFAYSIDVPNGAKVDFMKDGVVNAWHPCKPGENFKIYPGFVGYVFESIDLYNDFVRTGEECWSYRGGLDCRLHFKVGRGIQRWDDGDVYEGEFDVNDMHGQGVYTFKNGRKYVGEFKDDEPSGQGVMTWPDGTTFTGFFSEGTFDTSKPCEIIFSDGEMCRGRLDGRMKHLWDSMHDYCIGDMGKADPVYEGKPAAAGYWREAKIAKIEFEKKEEPEAGKEDQEDNWATTSTILCNACTPSNPHTLCQETTHITCLKSCEFIRPACFSCHEDLTEKDFYVRKLCNGVECYRKVYICKK